MSLDELENKIKILSAQIAALRINSAGGGCDPVELQKIWDELTALNSDFIALQTDINAANERITGADTKAESAIEMSKTNADDINRVNDYFQTLRRQVDTNTSDIRGLQDNPGVKLYRHEISLNIGGDAKLVIVSSKATEIMHIFQLRQDLQIYSNFVLLETITQYDVDKAPIIGHYFMATSLHIFFLLKSGTMDTITINDTSRWNDSVTPIN